MGMLAPSADLAEHADAVRKLYEQRTNRRQVR